MYVYDVASGLDRYAKRVFVEKDGTGVNNDT
jgi:hypothetical protein